MRELHKQLCECGCGGLTSGKFNHSSKSYSRFITGHSNRMENTKQARRIGLQKALKLGHLAKSEEWKKKASESKKGSLNPQYGNSEHMRSIASLPGRRNGMFGKPSPSGNFHEFTDKKGRSFKFRSNWEVVIAQWFDKKNLTWEYEPKRFDLGTKTYAPDFWIEEFNCFWEIKGWFHDRHKNKIELFRELFPEIKLVVINIQMMRSIFGKNFV